MKPVPPETAATKQKNSMVMFGGRSLSTGRVFYSAILELAAILATISEIGKREEARFGVRFVLFEAQS